MEWSELRRAFEHIISDQSKKFLFLIDGLDEFDGQPEEIIELVLSATQPNVKLCIASRPWLPFQKVFKDRPSLLLETLTKQDISTYVESRLRKDIDFIRLQSEEPVAASELIHDIVKKAPGVFLWVRLVV